MLISKNSAFPVTLYEELFYDCSSVQFWLSEVIPNSPTAWEKVLFLTKVSSILSKKSQSQGYHKLLIYYLVSHRDIVTVQGGHWDARKAATHLVFPPGFVAKDTALTLFRWKPSQRSPPLQPNEAVVSNVLELSAEGAEGLQFKRKVTVGISHSGPDLRGYEVVIKNLTDAERNEWEEAEETVDFRSVSGRGWLLSSIYYTLGLIWKCLLVDFLTCLFQEFKVHVLMLLQYQKAPSLKQYEIGSFKRVRMALKWTIIPYQGFCFVCLFFSVSCCCV